MLLFFNNILVLDCSLADFSLLALLERGKLLLQLLQLLQCIFIFIRVLICLLLVELKLLTQIINLLLIILVSVAYILEHLVEVSDLLVALGELLVEAVDFRLEFSVLLLLVLANYGEGGYISLEKSSQRRWTRSSSRPKFWPCSSNCCSEALSCSRRPVSFCFLETILVRRTWFCCWSSSMCFSAFSCLSLVSLCA